MSSVAEPQSGAGTEFAHLSTAVTHHRTCGNTALLPMFSRPVRLELESLWLRSFSDVVQPTVR